MFLLLKFLLLSYFSFYRSLGKECDRRNSLVAQQVKDRCCHCCGPGYFCGTGLIPSPGTSMCLRHGKKKKRERKRKCDWKMITRKLLLSILYLCIFGHALSMWKFLGQGLNPHHSSNLGHCSDDTGSLTCCTTRELPIFFSKSVEFPVWHNRLRIQLQQLDVQVGPWALRVGLKDSALL